MENAGKLVDVIVSLTGWSQVKLVTELRKIAVSLQEPDPAGLSAVTVNRWRLGRQRPSAFYSRLLRLLHERVSADVSRLEFLQSRTALAGPLLVDGERLRFVLNGRARVDGALLDSLEQVTRELARQWHLVPPEVLLPAARRHLQALSELRLRAHSPALDRRLQALSAEAAALVGWEVWLAGDRTTCDAYYALARELADDAGHGRVTGFVLVARSFPSSVLFGGPAGRGGRILELLDEAVAVSAGASPHLRAFALLRRAEERAAWAGAGAAARARSDVDAAEALLGPGGARPGGFFDYLDHERVLGTRGTCAGLLGEDREAVRVLSGVIAATPPALAAERSVLLTDLAAAHARTGEVEHACELLGRSVSLGHRSDVNRTQRIHGVRRTLLERWADLPAVRRLDEQLRLHAGTP
jgi:hypothetical protein